MKEYEIWLGYYHMGQGHHPPSKPEKVADVVATSFRVACWLYELKSQYDFIVNRMEKDPNAYIEGTHFGTMYYQPKYNGNSWTGSYYESKKEAKKSFK